MNKQNDSVNELNKQLNALRKFPDQNPNPVLRMSMDGKLQYTNDAGQYIRNEWKIGLGDDMSTELVEHSKLDTSLPLEMEVGNKVFAFYVITVPEFGFINIYGTDITASRDNELILMKLSKYFLSLIHV